jgi:hypothetical protein
MELLTGTMIYVCYNIYLFNIPIDNHKFPFFSNLYLTQKPAQTNI